MPALPIAACVAARYAVDNLRTPAPNSFYPIDQLKILFTKETIQATLCCKCSTCEADMNVFKIHDEQHNYPDMITGGSQCNDRNRTYYTVFGLLVLLEHPQFIIGFRNQRLNDYSLESWATDLLQVNLEALTGSFRRTDPDGFERFGRKFDQHLREFAIPHLEPDEFSAYRKDVVMPFIDEEEIGKKVAGDRWTQEGANGRVFAFKIHSGYNLFPNTNTATKFVRKCIATTNPSSYLEHSSIRYVQELKDDHIVRLLKAYSYGETINFILPQAWTNLDHLLRDPLKQYDHKAQSLERADTWNQMLGISRALQKMHGLGDDSVNSRVCVHFDLKPDNILIERSNGKWLITDFGQAAVVKRQGVTPRMEGHFGTYAYAPPEIDDEIMNAGRSYDIWSLGCIMLEVTAFMVHGHDGLVGKKNGLDVVRRAKPKQSRHTDDRFFYRIPPSQEAVVKQEILKFMADLETSFSSLGHKAESQLFLVKVLSLIKSMLKPRADERVDIITVVNELSSAIPVSPEIIGRRRHRVHPHPGERILEGAGMERVKTLMLSPASKRWEPHRLAILINEAGFLRVHCWDQEHTSHDITLQNDRAKVLPCYAFWDSTKARFESTPWLELLSMGRSGSSAVPGSKFAFKDGRHTAGSQARLVQSVLTSQRIVGSFFLSQITLSKSSSLTASLSRTVRRWKSTDATEADTKSFMMNGATLQIWVEQPDGINIPEETYSPTGRRPARNYDGDRSSLPPSRLCIYLHESSMICTIRLDLNWELGEEESENQIYLRARSSAGSPKFYASWLRPTPSEGKAKYPAGIPLDPKILRYCEDADSVELEKVKMTFPNAGVLLAFKKKYHETKAAWIKMRRDNNDEGVTNEKTDSNLQAPEGIFLPEPKQRVPIPIRPGPSDPASSTSTSMDISSRDSSTNYGNRPQITVQLMDSDLLMPP